MYSYLTKNVNTKKYQEHYNQTKEIRKQREIFQRSIIICKETPIRLLDYSAKTLKGRKEWYGTIKVLRKIKTKGC